jgi:predicted metalloendopeptidase
MITRGSLTPIGNDTGETLYGDDIGVSFNKLTEAMYARAYFAGKSKERVQQMTYNIIDALKDTLNKNDWMSKKTKKNATKKIEHMIPYVLYSDEVMDNDKINEFYKIYKSVDMTDNYDINIENLYPRAVLLNARQKRLELDRKDRKRVDFAPIVNNAFYYVEKNSFSLNMGFVAGFSYNLKRPDIFNYAALGSVIGHEITHGFDSNGRKYDYKGQ